MKNSKADGMKEWRKNISHTRITENAVIVAADN